MKKLLTIVILGIATAAFADDMSFWYNDDATVTNRVAASSVQAVTTLEFDMQLYAFGSVFLQRFISNPPCGVFIMFK